MEETITTVHLIC